MGHKVINIEKLCDITIIINDKVDHEKLQQMLQSTLLKVIKQAMEDDDNPK